MSTTPKAEPQVHRLVDIVVEEISLVDRAANKHRFLIVKRDDTMTDEATTDTPDDEAGSAPTSDTPPTDSPPDDPPLGAAIAALEQLTSAVESFDGGTEGLAHIAEELRVAADQLAPRADGATTPPSPDAGAGDAPAPSPDTSKELAAMKEALARLSELVTRALPAHTAPPPPPAVPPAAAPVIAGAEPAVTERLDKLAGAIRALNTTVQKQQQRLGRVEKQFGLPHSTAVERATRPHTLEDESWPLDLNAPKGRRQVDKDVSFHDL